MAPPAATSSLIGEGWNFGEVANGARFVQASQGAERQRHRHLQRPRARRRARRRLLRRRRRAGQPAGLRQRPLLRPQRPGAPPRRNDLLRLGDLVKVGLAGTIRELHAAHALGRQRWSQIELRRAAGAGYASQPGEVVNYVENHDNQTLFDINASSCPPHQPRRPRAGADAGPAPTWPSARAWPTSTPASTRCAARAWTATATTAATGSTAWTGPTATTTSASACRARAERRQLGPAIGPLLANASDQAHAG
jgi:hypothetical protein